MNSWALACVGAAGFDGALVLRLARSERRHFVTNAALSVCAALLVGAGMGLGAQLSFSSPWVAFALALAFSLLTLNLFRLLHAGTGYAIHLPFEDIDGWRPSAIALGVFFFIGLLTSQPLVTAVLGRGEGLIGRTHAAWQSPILAVVVSVAFALLVSAPCWLRLLWLQPLRAYEKERWIEDRLRVDDAFADAQDIITHLLLPVPGFSGTLQVHTADPPYNTRPLVFGLDPALLVRGNIKWVKPKQTPPPETIVEAEPPQASPPPPPPPPPPSPPVPPPPPPAARRQPAAPAVPAASEEVVGGWDDPSHDDDPSPPTVMFFDIGRLQVKRARSHIDIVAPFLSRMSGKSEEEVRGLLRVAPDDERVHRLFTDYKKLRSILLQDAGFALQHGLAPVVALIVQRPLADVEKRLRAAPAERRLTGVFAPELARRLLGKNVQTQQG